MMRRARIAEIAYYLLLIVLAGVTIASLVTEHFTVAFISLFFGPFIFYFVYAVIAWLLRMPIPDITPPAGGGDYCDELDPASPCFNYPYFQMVVEDDGTNDDP